MGHNKKKMIPRTHGAHAMRVVMISGQTSWEVIGLDLLVLLGFGLGSKLLGILLFQHETAVF